ncbi:UV DNA damage repair endonuclease UvsE [Bacillus kwashiorkori]|uniref:UV DNA damage repair endonuclease UvsE n=1 Tax=Bacillus kwashiorkori TaxID=1522318 RepID=UPI0007838BB2|nr:UV DNA damage repair endonuclease UvsE [Bacillus kwashiorkori]
MTLIRLGYVAMSVHLPNSSPSHTMTFAHYNKLQDEEAARRKLVRIAMSNLESCLRLLHYNLEHDIHFFRLSSRLIPLATHEALLGWNYLTPLEESFAKIRDFLRENRHVRVDFHPDHFVILNSPKAGVLQASVDNLQVHLEMLQAFGLNPLHRCVLHVGGGYGNKEKALEQFVHNFAFIPEPIQSMLMLENDDKVFTVQDTLYLCEKLGLPIIFDLHHHQANNDGQSWESNWERIVATWNTSALPLKMHISSPKSPTNFRAHADYIEVTQLHEFLQTVKGTVDQIDIMIEAKQKDDALFRLAQDLQGLPGYEKVNQASFLVR